MGHQTIRIDIGITFFVLSYGIYLLVAFDTEFKLIKIIKKIIVKL